MDKCEYACSKNAMTKKKKRDTKKKNYEIRALLQFCCCYCCCAAAAADTAVGYVFRVGPSMPFIYAFCALRFVLPFALLGVSQGGRAKFLVSSFFFFAPPQGH